MNPLQVVLRLARALTEKGHVVDAVDAIDAAIVLVETGVERAAAYEQRAASVAEFAKLMGWSPRHVARLVRRSEVITVGRGRALRILVPESVAHLRALGLAGQAQAQAKRELDLEDPIEALGRKHAAQRARLKLLRGGDDGSR